MTVANRYYPYDVTLAPGSTPGAPVSTRAVFEDVILKRIDVRIPPGPRGAVGFYITLAGTPIVPWGLPPTYLIADDEPLGFDVNAEANGEIVVVGYNTGVYPHTLYFRFQGTPTSLAPAGITAVTIQDLNT